MTKSPDGYLRIGLTGDIRDAVLAGSISQHEADTFLAALHARGFTKLAEDADITARIEQGVSKMLGEYSQEAEDEARADSHHYFARRGFWR